LLVEAIAVLALAILGIKTAAIAAGWRQIRGRLLNYFGIAFTPCKRSARI
jgi:hypothetical protein